MKIIYFGGGCFWCIEAIFKMVKGVLEVTSGYSGGETENPTYGDVSSGETGHAEVLEVKYDETKVSFDQLLKVFFEIHDPTTKNQQGNDVGTQYRSIILYTDEDQKEKSLSFVSNIKNATTEVVQFKKFYKAEDYHMNYFENNKDKPYCQFVIRPKLEKFLKSQT
jgi:methionine-S-sulfoxide reductase